MAAQDGAYDAVSETLEATIDTSGWTAGSYTLYVDARDAASNWGPASAPSITVTVDPKDDFSVANAAAGAGNVQQGATDALLQTLTFPMVSKG